MMCYLCYSRLLNLILYLKTLNFHLCYVLLNIVYLNSYFSTDFFDNITICINIPNVTLSNMSHLIYITLFGETDGVTLSRLGCSNNVSNILTHHKPHFVVDLFLSIVT